MAGKLLACHPDVFIVAAGGEPHECAAESAYAARNALHEPQGMTMLESMASGCITVSSRVGGIPESISHGESGFLLENPHDADEVLHLVEHVLDNIRNLDALRAAARKQIIENFSWDKLAMRMESIYFDLAA